MPPTGRRVEAEGRTPVLLQGGHRHAQPVPRLTVGLVVLDIDGGRCPVVGGHGALGVEPSQSFAVSAQHAELVPHVSAVQEVASEGSVGVITSWAARDGRQEGVRAGRTDGTAGLSTGF
ncbi:hypothetical protein GCM10023075_34980 [Streptosporangium album]